jgi:hypothetical protein
MATKQSGLLVTLGKRMLGFSASSTGCCAAPAAAETDKPEAKAAEEAAGSGCCGSPTPATQSTKS